MLCGGEREKRQHVGGCAVARLSCECVSRMRHLSPPNRRSGRRKKERKEEEKKVFHDGRDALIQEEERVKRLLNLPMYTEELRQQLRSSH